jgi:hypothetical protein
MAASFVPASRRTSYSQKMNQFQPEHEQANNNDLLPSKTETADLHRRYSPVSVSPSLVQLNEVLLTDVKEM